jgi:hypothetical protein
VTLSVDVDVDGVGWWVLWGFVGLAMLADTLVVVEPIKLMFGRLGVVWVVVKLVVVPKHSVEHGNVVRLVGKLVVATLV